jgi:hypothetical protein
MAASSLAMTINKANNAEMKKNDFMMEAPYAAI